MLAAKSGDSSTTLSIRLEPILSTEETGSRHHVCCIVDVLEELFCLREEQTSAEALHQRLYQRGQQSRLQTEKLFDELRP